jgi:hypothetical protein
MPSPDPDPVPGPVIAPVDQAAGIASRLTEHAHQLPGPRTTCRSRPRSLRWTGHVRTYLTVTWKDSIDDNNYG